MRLAFEQSGGTNRIMQIANGSTVMGLEDTSYALPGGGGVASFALRRDGTSGQCQFGVGGSYLTRVNLLHTRLAPSIAQASGSYNVLDISPVETAANASTGTNYHIRARLNGTYNFGVRTTGQCDALNFNASGWVQTAGSYYWATGGRLAA